MWDSTKQQKLDDLRQREQDGMLTPDEQQMLGRLLQELEQAEWSTLQPTLSQLRHEHATLREVHSHLQTQNVALAELAARYSDLLARAQAQLKQLTSEHEALRVSRFKGDFWSG